VATLPPTKRAGGRRASGTKKARATDAATAAPITPKSGSEVRLLVQSLTTARRECRADGGMKVYRRAAELYLEGVTTAHLGGAPPADLRDAKTSGELIKAALQATHKGAQAVRRERERADGEAAAGDLLAELLAAADAADDGAAADDDADAKPAKRQRGETAAEKQKRLKKLAKDLVRGANGKTPRELTLSELRFVVASSNPPKELTTLVLRAYLYAAGRKPATFDASTKVYFAGELIGIIESEKATAAKWSPAAGKLEFR
jgi:hypothetical protein